MHRTAPAISPGDEAGAPRCASSRCSLFCSVFSAVDGDTTRVDPSFLRPCSASMLTPSLPPSAAAACGLVTDASDEKARRVHAGCERDAACAPPACECAKTVCGVSALTGLRTFATHFNGRDRGSPPVVQADWNYAPRIRRPKQIRNQLLTFSSCRTGSHSKRESIPFTKRSTSGTLFFWPCPFGQPIWEFISRLSPE
jgi:hypothetical protein